MQVQNINASLSWWRLKTWSLHTSGSSTCNACAARRGLYGNNPGIRLTRTKSSKQSQGSPDLLEADSIIEKVINRVKESGILSAVELVGVAADRGLELPTKEQSSINDLLGELESIGKRQQPRPLVNPIIFGNYDVAYTSIQRAAEQKSQPAGGRFRSKIGKAVFKTKAVCQSIIPTNTVVNKVDFKFLGCVDGSVQLRGTLEDINGKQETARIEFQQPRLSLGGCIQLNIGPKSSVVFTTIYLDEQVRVGRGSQGSLFVFTRGGQADSADMEQVGLGKTTAVGWVLLAGALAALLKSTTLLWNASGPVRAASALPAILLLLVGQAATAALLQKPSAA